jgi:hypothetical protein
MPQANTITEIETAEYLRRLSQSAYNIKLIIDIHRAPLHYFDKKLDQFYTDATIAGGEKEKLINLLNRPIGVRKFPFRENVLVRNLVTNECESKRDIRYLNIAKEELLSLLVKIQDERKKSSTYEATTGPEEGPLKNYIVSIINEKKKDYSLSLLGVVESNSLPIPKTKRTNLPRFPRSEWSKVSIKFIDERNIIISDSKETKSCVPESLGCLDGRTQKPDYSWEFLSEIARGNGTTKPKTKIERETMKKHKQKITDILRQLFRNDTDPFETDRGGIYVAKFKANYINNEEDKIIQKEKPEYLDLNEYYSKTTTPSSKNIDYDIKHNINSDKDGEFSQ